MGEYIYRAMEARMKRIFKYIISQTLNIIIKTKIKEQEEF